MAVRCLKGSNAGQFEGRDINTPGFVMLVGNRTKTFLAVNSKHRKYETIGYYPEVIFREAKEQAK